MIAATIKVCIAAFVVVFASWLSGKKPELAGFITALPLVSIMALAFSYYQHQDFDTTSQYARSIILAVPISWLFFIPFFLSGKMAIGFWPSWALGLMLIAIGYFIHQWLLKVLF